LVAILAPISKECGGSRSQFIRAIAGSRPSLLRQPSKRSKQGKLGDGTQGWETEEISEEQLLNETAWIDDVLAKGCSSAPQQLRAPKQNSSTNASTSVRIPKDTDERLACMDGRVKDMRGKNSPSAALVPLISISYFRAAGWMPITPVRRRLIRRLASRAHSQGRKLRLWGAPESYQIWRELLEDGVDVLSVDNQAELHEFLTCEQCGDGLARAAKEGADRDQSIPTKDLNVSEVVTATGARTRKEVAAPPVLAHGEGDVQ